MEIKDVENLAEMSKIELSEEEKAKILSDMDGILDYVKQIEGVEIPEDLFSNPENVEYKQRNIWREDDSERGAEFSADLIKGQFPDKDGDYVKVKKVL